MTSLDKGILNISQSRVVITLTKKGKNIKNILIWRPISLSNVDYKYLIKYLIKWVSVIYNNINSCIINKGHISEGFTVTTGVR